MKVWISTTGARRRRRTALHALRRRPRCCSRLTWGRTHSALKRSPVGVAVHARPPARPSLIMRSQKGGGLRNNPIPTVRTPSLSRVHVRIVVKVLIETFFRLRFCAASAIAVPAASPQLHTSLPVLYMSLVCLSVFFSIRKNRRLITETEACICH